MAIRNHSYWRRNIQHHAKRVDSVKCAATANASATVKSHGSRRMQSKAPSGGTVPKGAASC